MTTTSLAITTDQLEAEALHYARLTLICDGPQAAVVVLAHYQRRIEACAS